MVLRTCWSLNIISFKFLKKTVLYRVILVGKISNQNRIDLGDYYDKLFKNMQNDSKASPYQERVTGLIILYPTVMIHCIEVIYI